MNAMQSATMFILEEINIDCILLYILETVTESSVIVTTINNLPQMTEFSFICYLEP